MTGGRSLWLGLALMGMAAAPATPARVLPFIEDDYPKALAEARSHKVPIFIEASAPW